jgi:hypothetical protein
LTFSNINLGLGALFIRAKSESIWGDPPSQEYIGFTDDPPIYFPGNAGTAGMPENMNLRGWNGYKLGDQLLYFTTEMRIPFIESLPVNLIMFSLGDISGALFTDNGLTWKRGENIGKTISTAGYELKIALKIGGSPLFYYSVGYAQELDDWVDKKKPSLYMRYALVNPF